MAGFVLLLVLICCIPTSFVVSFLIPRRPLVFGFQPLLTPGVSPCSTSNVPTVSRTLSGTSALLHLFTAPTTTDDDFVEADDLEALQELFAKYCDKEGLMTKAAVGRIPAISNMMAEGDLLPEEFDDIWKRAPKFPDLAASEERIDVDSFVQVYRDIDDLFEAADNQEVTAELSTAKNNANISSIPTTQDSTNGAMLGDDKLLEDELEAVFETLSDKAGLVSKQVLKDWDEVRKLLDENLLGEDEFDDIWKKTKKSPGDEDALDIDGFLSFNVALDSLFEFNDDALDDDDDADGDENDFSITKGLVSGNLAPEELFAALAGPDGLVAQTDLLRWSELQDMLKEGDLSTSELDDIIDRSVAAKGQKLDLEAFVKLYTAVNDLFEVETEGEQSPVAVITKDEAPKTSGPSDTKASLLRILDIINDVEDRLPCGLEASDREANAILNLVKALEREPSNLIQIKKGAVDMYDLAGTWELLYSSSSAMKFNKGLSGLGGSVPNGRFGGVVQKLVASKFMTDVEYIERILVNPAAASFDVRVTGNWDVRESTSLFTGEPTIILTVTPVRVEYGPTSMRADHWKSLGPLNVLDVVYLDEDLRIMRGSTSVDTIFVFRRCS